MNASANKPSNAPATGLFSWLTGPKPVNTKPANASVVAPVAAPVASGGKRSRTRKNKKDRKNRNRKSRMNRK